MVDELRTNLIVEAIHKGFPQLTNQMKQVGAASNVMKRQLEMGGVALGKVATASGKLEKQTNTLSAAQKRMAQVGRQQQAQLARQAQKTRELAKAQEEAAEKAQKLAKAQMMVGAAMVAAAAVGTKLLAGTTQLAARVETLGVVTATLGKNVGKTETEMRALEKAVMDQGITTQAARQSIALMIQAEIDLAHATDLARLAQDAAVISGTNSSDAFSKLTYVISSGSVIMARRMGLMVDFQGAYQREAEALGKSSAALTAHEKVTIRTNEVMRQGANISGAYSAAMETAGKKITSVARHLEESQRIIGETFLPIYASLIDMVTNLLKSWERLDGATQRQASAGIAVGVAWTGLIGTGLLVVGMLAKIKTALITLGLAGHAALGPIGLITAALAILTTALATSAAKTQYFKEQIKLVGIVAKDTSQSYEEYVAAAKKVGEENNRVVRTYEELNALIEDHMRKTGADTVTTAAYFQFMNLAADSVTLLSKAAYDANQAQHELSVSTLTVTQKMDLMRMRTSSVGERLRFLEKALADVSEEEKAVADETERVTARMEELATIVSGPVTQAWEAFGAGDEGAITDMLYNLVSAGDAMKDMGDTGTLAMEGLSRSWGMFDQQTSDVLGAIKVFQKELAAAGDTVEEQDAALALFNQRMRQLGIYLMDSSAAAHKATPNIVALIEAIDRDIQSPMVNFRKDIEWFIAGGAEIAAQFTNILNALSEGNITPEQAHALMEPLIIAASDLKVDIGQESLEEASKNLADALGVGIDEAREMILSTEGIVGALEEVGKTEIEIKAFEDFNKKREETEKALEAMGDKGKYPIGISYDGLTEAQKQRKILEDDLLLMTSQEEGKFKLPFDYTLITEARTKGLSELTGELDVIIGRENPLQMNTAAIGAASSEISGLETQLIGLTQRAWIVNVTTAYNSIGEGAGNPYVPPYNPDDSPYNPYVLPDNSYVSPAPPEESDSDLPQCFTGETMVSLPDEHGNGTHKAIADIKLGDLVYAYDEKQNQIVTGEVIELWMNTRNDLVTVDTEFGEIHCSPNHRWFTQRGWVEALDLIWGDAVLCLSELWVIVNGVDNYEGEHAIYNLTVDKYQTYFVLGMLVHNVKPKSAFAGGVRDFIVPPGFYEPQNPFTIGVSSGEVVNVKRAGEAMAKGGGGDNYIALHAHLASDLDVPNVVDMILDELGNRVD